MKKIALTQGKFAIVDDEDFEWLNQWKWYLGSDGYAARTIVFKRIDGKQPKKNIYMHRLLIKISKGFETDHINRNKLDNRKVNLRRVNRSQNSINISLRSNNVSGFKGVHWNKQRNKWRVKLNVNKKEIYLGLYVTQEEAALAYNQAAQKYFGEFAFLNQIGGVV